MPPRDNPRDVGLGDDPHDVVARRDDQALHMGIEHPLGGHPQIGLRRVR